MKKAGFSLSRVLVLMIAAFLLTSSCTKNASSPQPPSKPSDINVEVRDGGPVVLTTSAAEFDITPSGFVQAFLLKDGKKLTLDEPGIGSAAGSDYLVHEGKELQFIPEFGQTKTLESIGKLGRGKRVDIPGRPLAPSGTEVQGTLTV